MELNTPLVSICIPTYNRPNELKRALYSIDSQLHDIIDIIISENCSPLQKETREVVEEYTSQSPYNVHYYEQPENVGYDRNIRGLIDKADGEYIVFLSDDDVFISGQLDLFITFIQQHRECGYILRSYRNINSKGKIDEFRYFNDNMVFPASENTYITMFDKSVFISGFTIKKEYAQQYKTDSFDGSLLYQLYVLAEVCRTYPSAYYNNPITQSFEGGIPYFGNSESEKGLYESGKNSVQNSLNFMNWYVRIVDYIAEKYNDDSNIRIKHNMSKYSYPFLSAQRKRGIKTFTGYAKALKEMGFASSNYFYFYYLCLLLFGTSFCNRTISFLKKIIGRRPSL